MSKNEVEVCFTVVCEGEVRQYSCEKKVLNVLESIFIDCDLLGDYDTSNDLLRVLESYGVIGRLPDSGETIFHIQA